MSRWSHPFLFAVGVVLVPSAAHAAEPDKLACIAANDAAQDLRRSGKLSESRERLAVCVSPSCPGLVRDDCAQRLAEVDAATPSVVFDVRDAHGLVVTDARVQLDGQPFADHVDATARPVDPGTHRFTFDAADGAHAEQTIVLHEKEKNTPVAVVLLAPATATVAVAAPAASDWTTQKTIGVGLGGVGVVGLVVGSIFGAMALSDASALKSQAGCPSSCPPSAQSQIDTLHGHQWASDIVLGLGVVSLGVGAALFFTAHPSEAAPATSLRFDIGPGAVGLRGGF
jgi:hypothetical protein